MKSMRKLLSIILILGLLLTVAACQKKPNDVSDSSESEISSSESMGSSEVDSSSDADTSEEPDVEDTAPPTEAVTDKD